MNTIVLATDGSPWGAKATEIAIELAAATKAPLHVVTAWSIPASAFGYAPLTVAAELGDAERKQAETASKEAAAQAEAAGIPVTYDVRQGVPVTEICAAAEEHDAGLIVLGAHGWGALKRLLFGSVSTGVLHNASSPVLVVPGGTARTPDEELVAAQAHA